MIDADNRAQAAERNRADDGYHRGCANWVIEPGTMERHTPGADTIEHTNLRAFAAAPDRLEHFLEPVAEIDGCVIENATASEPLFFGHINVSDEYNFLMLTGDPLMDHGKGRTFFFEPETDDLVGYAFAGPGDVVVHPQGLVHWPAQLKDPFTPVPEGDERRKIFTLVYCSYARQVVNESARPDAERRVHWKRPEGPYADAFPGVPIGQGRTKVSAHAERFGVMNLFALATEPEATPHRLTTVGRVGSTQIDCFFSGGPRGEAFPNPDGCYVICYHGACRVEITKGDASLATWNGKTADMIKLPAGASFDTFHDGADANHTERAIFLVFRCSPDAGSDA